jgi:hypothetical protein
MKTWRVERLSFFGIVFYLARILQDAKHIPNKEYTIILYLPIHEIKPNKIRR